MKQIKKLVEHQENIVLLSKPGDGDFERAYIEVRDKEARILTDEQVFLLPEADIDSPHYREWQIRGNSANKLSNYVELANLDSADWVLDIGCGNGWFSHLLAKGVEARVLGIDINLQELEQAARVFKRDNLHFAYLDLLNEEIEPEQFSLILFNSSFQYFDEPEILLEHCFSLLNDNGEIHIIDSPFYRSEEIVEAKSRTREYYQKLDAEEMIVFYHHHTRALFNRYNLDVLYSPPENNTLKAKNDSPFPWLKITK